ncbi:MAG: N-acetyltransferase [Acidimicrobiia bacterium]|nr:N-acetyltransferase [Acidimicrobiia bacterium]
MPTNIRIASAFDGSQIHAIYAPAVSEQPTSFETEVPAVDEIVRRIDDTLATYPYIVAERDGEIVSYVYARRWRPRPAYDWDVEITVFVKDGNGGRGIGRAMYTALTRLLAAQGFANALAAITVPNDASIKFHESMGFHRAAVFPSAGFKLGAWHTVECWWKQLADLPDEPHPPIPFKTFRTFPECEAILQEATALLTDGD